MRQLKTREVVRPRTRTSRETRTASLTLSGRWFESLGFAADAPVWIDDSQPGLITIHASDPTPAATGSLEELKATFAALGIPTTRRGR